MFEVEAKIKIDNNELKWLRNEFKKRARLVGQKCSADTYYETEENCHMRIRESANNYVFTVKRRQTIKGIESNTEMEWDIRDVRRWKALLSRLGIRPMIRKYKKSTIFKLDDFSLELHQVRHLGNYLEIEKQVRNESGVGEAKKELLKLMRELGFSPKRFEPRPYLELLKNV